MPATVTDAPGATAAVSWFGPQVDWDDGDTKSWLIVKLVLFTIRSDPVVGCGGWSVQELV